MAEPMCVLIPFRGAVRRLLTDIRRHAPGGACPKPRSGTASQTMRGIGLALSLLFIWAAAAQADLTIMPLGASTTYGGAPGYNIVPGGYRTRLYTDLQNAGLSFTFVGTVTDNASTVLTQAGQIHHEGHPGYRIDQIASNLIGGNEINQNAPTATSADRLDALVGKIVADSPTSILFISSVTPFKINTASQNQLLDALNAQIRDVIVPKYASLGANVTFVDQYANFVDANGNFIHVGADGIHPDQTGYDLMGDTWAAAIQQVLPLPIAVTGYSADVISDKDPSARFAQPFGSGTFAWFEAGAVDDNGAVHNDGLPAGQTFVSATRSNVTYQIQPANANSVLQLGAGQTGTLTLMTPAAYNTLYVLASSGDGTPTSMGSGNINFADGSTQAFSYNTFDWCNGPFSLVRFTRMAQAPLRLHPSAFAGHVTVALAWVRNWPGH